MSHPQPTPAGAVLFTVGHSTRSLDAFVELVRGHGIALVVDVRRFPGSRRHPWFAREPLGEALAGAGIGYRHEPDLGGRRGEPDSVSPNRAWRNASFRAYADHLASPEFGAALERVLAAVRKRPTAVMCAEAVPWRCHRRLIADVATARGWRVLHVLSPDRVEPHVLHEDARVEEGGVLIYPGPAGDQGELF